MRGVRVFLVLAIAVVGIAYLVFSSGSRRGNPIPGELVAGDANDLVVGEPLRFQNLAIFPVFSQSQRHDDRFITLDEGLKDGSVEIFEKGAAPQGDSAGEPAATTETEAQ